MSGLKSQQKQLLGRQDSGQGACAAQIQSPSPLVPERGPRQKAEKPPNLNLPNQIPNQAYCPISGEGIELLCAPSSLSEQTLRLQSPQGASLSMGNSGLDITDA